ncbi:MAG: zinc ribbon domain-containing protein [Clostridia bacterium]|nr:zinc ribbon domain-containing protein [Clostridia bacterium]
MFIRLIKTLMGKVDTYEGTIECSKSLDEVLDLVRHFREKRDFWLSPHEVIKDVRNFGYYDIGKGPKNAPNQKILWHFTVMYMNGVAYQVKLRLTTCCSKIVFNEFKKQLEALPDLEKVNIEEPAAPAIDYATKTMLELVELLDESASNFADAPSASMFEPMKAIKEELAKRIKKVPLDARGQFSQPMSQIDMYISTINTQLSNSVMAAQISSFAGTYVSQIQSQLPSIMSAVKALTEDMVAAPVKPAPVVEKKVESVVAESVTPVASTMPMEAVPVVPVAPVAPVASAMPVQASKKLCVNCGKENDVAAVYCMHCGKTADVKEVEQKTNEVQKVAEEKPNNKIITYASFASIALSFIAMLFIFINAGNDSNIPGLMIVATVFSALTIVSAGCACAIAFIKKEQSLVKVLTITNTVFALVLFIACLMHYVSIMHYIEINPFYPYY